MRRSVTILSAALCLVACSGSDEPEGPPPDPNVPLGELCLEVAAADCARLEACGALYPPLDVATCEATVANFRCGPVQAGLQAAVEGGSLDYFELAARECVSAVAARGCDVGLRSALLELPACRAMVTPRGEAGTACHVGFDCAEGFACRITDMCPGSCQPLLGNNQPCTFGDRCAEGLYCDVTAMRCLASVDTGGTCALESSGNACVAGSFCDRSNPAAPVCVLGRGRNEGCQSFRECANGAACVRNLCSLGLEGDTCNSGADCTADRICAGSRCRVPLASGDACVPGDIPCDVGLACALDGETGTCVPAPLPGDDCDTEADTCFGSRCVGGECVAGAADGEPCVAETDCLPGRACEGGRCAPLGRDCRIDAP